LTRTAATAQLEVTTVVLYTLGEWTVKNGREDDFVRAWSEMAERTKLDFPNEVATLLRDRDHPNRFISSGPWESVEQIEQWRNSETFKTGVGKLRDLVDDFSAHTMDLAAAID
jgi:heme-degrading monooxygenase HmoA